MPSNQIALTVPNSLKTWVDDYCREGGIHASELLRLLIIREKRLQRLSRLDPCRTEPIAPAERKRLTAYFSTSLEVEEFDAYAKSMALTRGRAAFLLLEAEVRDRWFERMISSA